MKSEAEYRQAVDSALRAANGDAIHWNNSFILACAFNGLIMIPITKGLPFPHYIQAPFPFPEATGAAWPESYLCDWDYEAHLKPQNSEVKFTFNETKEQ